MKSIYKQPSIYNGKSIYNGNGIYNGVDALPPCEAMTLRFKFSDPTYDPVVAGVGTGGTWNQVRENPNIWDWTNNNSAWDNALKDAFKDIGNLVEIINAGDTRGVTSIAAVFLYCSSLIKICPIDVSSAITVNTMFGHTGLEEIPALDTRNCEQFGYFATGCSALKKIPMLNTDKAKGVNNMFTNCKKVESGALALYQQMSMQTTPPTNTANCFLNCGIGTPTGLAELQQIPSSWGGLAP